MPVHCVVEAVCSVERPKRPAVVETDSYVIIPASTAFDDLVPVALAQLGYTRDTAAAATGSVVIKNWKPLSFDKIADGPLVSVGDILGELTTVATLRIQIFRSRPSMLADMRDKMLRLLLTQTRSLLLGSGCPLDELTLSQLCRGSAGGAADRLSEPPEDVRRKFEHWWALQLQQQQQQQQQHPQQPPHHRQPQQQQSQQLANPLPASQPPPPPPQQQQPRRTPSPRQVHRAHLSALSPASGLSLYAGGADGRGAGVPPLGAGGMDAVALSHKLMQDVHPALQTIQQYVRELNSLESRRGRKPLDVNNVVYWFKNARAAQKRAEIRSSGPGGHYMSQNGYSSNSHSPPGSGAPPHFLSPETLLTEGPHPGHPVGPGGRLLPMGPMGGMGMGGMPPWPLSSPPMAHMHRVPHVEMPRPHSVVSDDSDGEGGGPAGPGGQGDRSQQDDADSHADRNSPISLIMNRGSDHGREEDKDDEKKDEEMKDPKDMDLDVTNDDSRMSIKQEPNAGDDDAASTGHNNNNNNHVKDCEAMSDMEEDDEDEDEGSESCGGGSGAGSELQQQQQQQQLERYHQHHHGFRSPSPCGPPGAGALPFPMFSHSIMYMSQYLPGLAAAHPGGGQGVPGQPASAPQQQQGLNLSASDERRKRNRTFIDPVSEVPRLEQWFKHHTHPPHNLILKYTEELNHMPYRCKFPRLEPKNVQFWFKNRRAKDKRMKVSLFDNGPQSNHQQGVYHGQHSELMLKRE
ncbi:hypothetical protein FOCC_FOCC017103 [Frankliniella occidentalis]|nr:hypothetical protein FOCC_FOCC017103 [Frankliniella occidentalis]